MKKTILLLFAFMFIQKSIAQDTIASVEKSNFGIQTGLIGLWGFNEYKLSNPISLRSEIGVQLGFSTGYDKTYTTIFPSLSIEPRWYYNLNKRLRKGKNIKKNSGNYFSIYSIYNSNQTLYSSNENIDYVSKFAILPKWGIKRTYNNHLTFETNFGLGPNFYPKDFNGKRQDVYVDLGLRIGYTF